MLFHFARVKKYRLPSLSFSSKPHTFGTCQGSVLSFTLLCLYSLPRWPHPGLYADASKRNLSLIPPLNSAHAMFPLGVHSKHFKQHGQGRTLHFPFQLPSLPQINVWLPFTIRIQFFAFDCILLTHQQVVLALSPRCLPSSSMSHYICY